MGGLTGDTQRGCAGPVALIPCLSSLVLAAMLVIVACDAANADAATGAMLAAQLCAGCHAIRPGQNSPDPKAPPLAAIAAKGTYNIFTLRSFLRTPHWTAANLSLRAADSEAIASYVMSLAPRR